jgi:hypothetical protein
MSGALRSRSGSDSVLEVTTGGRRLPDPRENPAFYLASLAAIERAAQIPMGGTLPGPDSPTGLIARNQTVFCDTPISLLRRFWGFQIPGKRIKKENPPKYNLGGF